MRLSERSLGKESQLSNYERGQRIGMGGQAVVYGYFYPQSKEIYAVKVLRWEGKDEKDRELMNREVLYAKEDQQDAHPHLIQALECFEYPNEGFALIMPHFPAGDLYGVEANIKFSMVQKREAMRQLLDGLHHLHTRGRLHRDLKPNNVLVRTADPVSLVIIDFGQVSFSHPITWVGTFGYRAPEMKSCRKNRKTYTNAVDVFSLGMLLLWLLTPEVYQAEIPHEELWSLQEHHDVVDQHIQTAMDRFFHESDEHKALALAQRMTRWNPERRPSAEKCLKLPWLTLQRPDMPLKRLPTRRSSRLSGSMNSTKTQSGRVQKPKAKANHIFNVQNLHAPTKAQNPFGGMAAANANDVVKQEESKDVKNSLSSMEICT